MTAPEIAAAMFLNGLSVVGFVTVVRASVRLLRRAASWWRAHRPTPEVGND